MAVSSYPTVSRDTGHAYYLSQLYTLYCEKISWREQLCDTGYYGFPDPRFENGNEEYTPDLFAFGKDGDVQHFSVELFPELDTISEEDQRADYIADTLRSLDRFRNIENDMIRDYLGPWSCDPSLRDDHEIVALLPEDTYSAYTSTIKEVVDEKDLIIWTFLSNGSESIRLQEGSHSNLDLMTRVENSLQPYPEGADLLRFSRKTDRKYLLYEFVQRLVKYCSRERQRSFTFAEVDDVMTEMRPRMLWQLSREEREDYWKDFIYSLLNTHEVIEQTSNQNEYRWVRVKFQTEPRYRSKILTELKEDLGI